MWVKVCANTSLQDALLGVDAGADALGFVFAPSPRRVSIEQVAKIVPVLPESVEKIGVFVDASLNEIAVAVRTCGLTGVQLHSESGPELSAGLRAGFGANLRILRVVHFGADAAHQAGAYAADSNVDAVLVDSRTAIALGGTGVPFDWDEAGRTIFRSGDLKLIAAGGLHPGNVADAIGKLRPWGVDVASGVEASPGRKDPGKVEAFVKAARAASIR